MEIMLIDFDAQFSKYMKNWLDKNSDSYDDLEKIEMKVPEIYTKWLKTPADWLAGKKPDEYFMDFNANDLVNLLIRYSAKKIGVPDILLDTLVTKKQKASDLLIDIVLKKTQLPKNIDMSAIKIIAVHLIDEIGPQKYISNYIKAIAADDIDEDLADCMADSIGEYSKQHKNLLIETMLSTNNYESEKRFLDVLCDLPFDKIVYKQLISLLNTSGDKALFASFLGKYGNKDACKVLIQALDWMSINYLDYIEIKNAIEELGEEIIHNRNFNGDIYFESMKGFNNE